MTMVSCLRQGAYVAALFLCLRSGAQVAFTPPTQATYDEVYRWIESGDPRMVAWGAYFAMKNNNTEMIPVLERLAEGWIPLPTGSSAARSDEEKDRLTAMDSVLDAVIQMHATVAPDAIERLAINFRGQALTLFGKMPEAERTALAISIYGARQPGGEYVNPVSDFPAVMDAIMNHLALPRPILLPGFQDATQQRAAGELVRFAAAILSNDPPTGFAASLLNETTAELEVSVGGKDPNAGGGLGPGCGDSIYSPPKDWPEPWTYVVEERWPFQRREGDDVMVPGVPALTTQRSHTGSSCSTMGSFWSGVRVELLTQMIGLENGKLGWSLSEYEDVPYSVEFNYQIAVEMAVAKRERAFQATAAALAAKGFLTPEEAQSARPTLLVKVKDMRETKSPPLPEIKLPPGLEKVVVVSAGE